jgi:hypothetical protein
MSATYMQPTGCSLTASATYEVPVIMATAHAVESRDRSVFIHLLSYATVSEVWQIA